MGHTNAFNLEVIPHPRGKVGENADEREGPGRTVFLFVGRWFVRWSGSDPDNACWEEP